MSTPKFKKPWIAIDEDLPIIEDGAKSSDDVIWVDEDGSYHLARWNGKKVLPAVYGNADDVERNLHDFVCWARIQAPEAA